MTTIQELVSEMDSRIELIESYPDKRRPYADLYDTVMKALPFISLTEDKNGLFSHEKLGILGNSYIISYFSRFGITSTVVTDIRHADENRVVRCYTTGNSFGRKAPVSIIRELDPEADTEEIVQKNNFWKR